MQVKLYSFAWSLIDTISPKIVIGNLSWSSQINGGQGEVKIRLNLPISTTINADIVKIYITDYYYPNGEVVYTWVITKIAREIWDTEYIEITALWLATILWFKLQSNWTKTGSLSSIISDTIDTINISYPLYTKVIDTLTTSWSFDFQNRTLLDVVNTIKETWWSWTVDGKGNFIWKNKSNQTIHNLTLGKNVERISIIDNTEQVKNKAYIQWSSWTQMVEDTASISEYWIREYYESKTDITSSWYATTYWNSKIVWISRTLTLSIYDYDIYSIIPWHRITVRNTPISIQNLQVYKISYWNKKATIEVEKIDSISDALRN